MNKMEWKKKYKQTLIDHTHISKKFAEEYYQAGLENYDFNDCPEIAAMEDLSYWTS